MSAIATLLLFALAGVAGMAIVYSRRVTFPGYKGRGGVGVLLVAILGGITALWLLGLALGGNVFTTLATDIEFGLRYDHGFLKASTYLLTFGVLALLGVASWNLKTHGQIDQ